MSVKVPAQTKSPSRSVILRNLCFVCSAYGIRFLPAQLLKQPIPRAVAQLLLVPSS